MVRTFVTGDQLSAGALRLEGPAARHLGGALRLRPGEHLVVVTPDGVEHVCRVTQASPARVEALELEARPSPNEPRVHVRIAAALLKGDQLERIIEYASEAGASSFQPLLAERCVVKLEADRTESKLRRWREVARAGAELGQRGCLPEVHEPANIAGAVTAATEAGLTPIVLYEGRGLESLSTVDLGTRGVCLLVGPEGGWTEAEVERAGGIGAAAVTLGPRIMRPLPAALTALAVVLHRAGDLALTKEAT